MKAKDQVAVSDGFDKNVALKMPRLKKQEEFPSPDWEIEFHETMEEPLETKAPDPEPEKRVFLSSPKPAPHKEKPQDVLSLIEDLHAQLLVSNQTKRALETDLSSSQKTVQQLVKDNNELRSHLDGLRIEIAQLKEAQAETTYLKEENDDAIEKIKVFQEELGAANEALTSLTQEREGAVSRALELESQIEQIEVFRIKGRLREREASQLAEENRELRARLEELQLQNMELEREYGDMKRSFSEVKESLTFLRDSCKAQYYNLSESPE